MILTDLALLVDGKITGDPNTEIKRVSLPEKAQKGDLVFVLEEKYLTAAVQSSASALLVPEEIKDNNKPSIIAKNPRLAMAKILSLFAPPTEVEKGIHPQASIHKTAVIGKDVSIGPFSYIGPNSKIGDNVIIYPNVTIYQNVSIGNRCIIHSGARIGTDGYGFVPSDEGLKKIPQVGGVIIEDDVEIYANVCIARGTIGDTIIGKGTKIDNISHVAHNCKLGKNCAITSLVGFAGSVVLENNVSVGGQAGFAGHINVGENTVVMARSGVTKNIPPNSIISGFPAIDHKKDFEIQAALRKLIIKEKK
ncbi:MAG: UDP-3-O-3-hydroxymyristoyl glucosamine N-acyltransferase [Candidatus Saganbacteria bacterium]|uniref:UDP-3-O-acylglucosamine N-acyltransferase n=1 Tax=Candidatus Saganbacteria bacterium TaxID=2575572 RepID=A0A833L209_UNCSA|nr:MAG: UDP-3-O-3-hydroxymyristoyl glucosamine N-acyltransferase [Candidatus Saganbacteria bacterium]